MRILATEKEDYFDENKKTISIGFIRVFGIGKHNRLRKTKKGRPGKQTRNL